MVFYRLEMQFFNGYVTIFLLKFIDKVGIFFATVHAGFLKMYTGDFTRGMTTSSIKIMWKGELNLNCVCRTRVRGFESHSFIL